MFKKPQPQYEAKVAPEKGLWRSPGLKKPYTAQTLRKALNERWMNSQESELSSTSCPEGGETLQSCRARDSGGGSGVCLRARSGGIASRTWGEAKKCSQGARVMVQ